MDDCRQGFDELVEEVPAVPSAIREIRDFGQFVFWRDESRSVGYASAYFRKMAKSSADDQPKEEAPQLTDAP
ncbi:MAG: hypothetical protein R6V85_06320 [Polyangia bacterium]